MTTTAWIVLAVFVVAVAAVGWYFRRREADGSFDIGQGSAARPGVKKLFDFGPGGWSDDGNRQRPVDTPRDD